MKKKVLVTILLVGLTCLLFSTSPVQAATQAEIEAAISKGLTYLVAQQQPDGSWIFFGGVADISTTGLALVKLVDRAKELKLEPFDNIPGSPTYYPYANNVIAGFDYLFSNASADAAGVNFLGQIYSTGTSMMAVAATNNSSRVISTGLLSGQT